MQTYKEVGFEVVMGVTMKRKVFWVVTPMRVRNGTDPQVLAQAALSSDNSVHRLSLLTGYYSCTIDS
jgi:hypothetical protein